MIQSELFGETEEKMQKALEALGREFSTIRSGRAAPTLVEKLIVEAYGQDMLLNQLASISVPEARLMVIQPFDKNNLSPIERAIHKSDIGINPNNDGIVIRLAFPPLTEERRKDLVKVIKRRAEECRVSLRNIRREAMDELKRAEGLPEDDVKRAQDEIQKLTDKYSEEVNKSFGVKEQEIMEV